MTTEISKDLTANLVAPNGKHITLPTGLFINNEFVAGQAEPITSVNPATGEDITAVHAASAGDVDKAVRAAKSAFAEPAWRDMNPSDRGRLMNRLADLCEEHVETLATLECWDNGKPYAVALNEDLGEVVATLRYYAGWADKIHGQVIQKAGLTQQKIGFTLKQPIGVCAQIIPWNYPLSMAAWKLGPAIACGNTVVLKPAEQTPLSALYLATLIRTAGFPPGVINILNGLGRVTGQALASHPLVDKIAFTGSTATGKVIMATAAAHMTNVTLETGGKSPFVVFDSADLQQAAEWAYVGIFSNQGQVCTATSRLLLQDKIHDQVLDLLIKIVKERHVVGDPFSADTTQGPQVSKVQLEKILSYIEGAKSDGAKVLLGGSAYSSSGVSKNGYFVEPTIFADVTPEMKIFQEEVFGPVLAVTRFSTEEEAIAIANDSIYGLSAAVFSGDIAQASRVAERLEAGMVWINSSQDSDIRIPFGGVKQSGIGRELGESALSAYTQEKAVHLNVGMKL